jgi:hypothetical protein
MIWRAILHTLHLCHKRRLGYHWVQRVQPLPRVRLVPGSKQARRSHCRACLLVSAAVVELP